MSAQVKVTGFKTPPGAWDGGHTAWTEIKYIKDHNHFHMEVLRDDNGACARSYLPKETADRLTAESNGHYIYISDGDKYTVTRNGDLVESDEKQLPDGTTYTGGIWQAVTCAVLYKVYGEDFSGYEHNYKFANDHATEE